MERLFLSFDKIKPLSPRLKKKILSMLKKKECKKKDILLYKGDIARHIYFIDKGLLRSFRYEGKSEKIPWLMTEGNFCASISSFFSQTPANETIEVYEDSVLYYITYEELNYLYDHFTEFNRHGRVILQHYYKLDDERNYMREQSARYKFEYLMKHDIELVGRVKDKHLAAYIGVTPGTFSVQKNNFAKRNKKK